MKESKFQHLKDEEYLISRAKEAQYSNPFSAKSWLITAQAIFPKDFHTNFEIYSISKKEQNAKEAAVSLKFLFENFSHVPDLWTEINKIIDLLKNSTSENNSSPFLKTVFFSLPKESQKAIILSAIEHSTNELDYVTLMLFMISSFPENAVENGLPLVNALLKAEKSSDPLNIYRKKLVCDLLPNFLQANGIQIRQKLLHTLLSKTIEFYLLYSITPFNITKKKLELELPLKNPWQQLFSLIKLIGWNLGWQSATEFDFIENRDAFLEKVQKVIKNHPKFNENEENFKEIFFMTVTIFLHTFVDYSQKMCLDGYQSKNEFPNNDSSSPMTLIEAFTSPPSDLASHNSVISSPPFKRLKLSIEDPTPPIITVSGSTSQTYEPGYSLEYSESRSTKSIASSDSILLTLVSAIKCWNLIHSNDLLKTEFRSFVDEINIGQWLSLFEYDVLLYEGKLIEASHELEVTLAKKSYEFSQNVILMLRLKLATVYFALNKYSISTEHCLKVIENFSQLTTDGDFSPNLITQSSPSKRHLHVLALTQNECLQLIVTIMIYSLRNLIFMESIEDDACLGHLVILTQFEWPRHCWIFEEIIDIIRKKISFSFKIFAAYVTTPDILEEFMYLTKIGLTLDILPIPSNTVKNQRVSTRGADRDSKEDFKIAMRKQMLRCNESVSNNIITYLKHHGAFIVSIST